MPEKIWDDILVKAIPLDCIDNTEDFKIEVICLNGEFLQELSK